MQKYPYRQAIRIIFYFGCNHTISGVVCENHLSVPPFPHACLHSAGELVLIGIFTSLFSFQAIQFLEIEYRMFLYNLKKVFSGREIDFSGLGNRISARKNRFYGAEIEFSARRNTFIVKILNFLG